MMESLRLKEAELALRESELNTNQRETESKMSYVNVRDRAIELANKLAATANINEDDLRIEDLERTPPDTPVKSLPPQQQHRKNNKTQPFNPHSRPQLYVDATSTGKQRLAELRKSRTSGLASNRNGFLRIGASKIGKKQVPAAEELFVKKRRESQLLSTTLPGQKRIPDPAATKRLLFSSSAARSTGESSRRSR